MQFAATWMDLEIIILSEVSHKEKDIYITYMTKMNLFTKQKQTHRYRKQTYDYQRGKRVGEG